MRTPADGSGQPVEATRETPRVRLARVVAAATLRCTGVAALDPGRDDRLSTRTSVDLIPGVLVAADGEPGRHAVTVHVRARLVELHALADGVRLAVERETREHGLADALGRVRVVITDIALDGEDA
ncbi:hypothetical protein [Patulibacter minatonensis]|uniref:hypothetical protein n=1 Tax=Patulibacter minatonensis TaxID=298163 RepID=UPI00047A164F|nr:hypothetical protein [Patulibacter minatonensis]